MKKIPTLFVRDYSTKPPRLTEEVTPGCEWVLAGEGIATRKFDGTCCAVIRGALYKRLTVAPMYAPRGFRRVAQDLAGNKDIGWVPVDAADRSDRWHVEALPPGGTVENTTVPDGTYELIGPKVNGGRDDLYGGGHHLLVRHGFCAYEECPRNFTLLCNWLSMRDIEGVVWHHPDGRMAKIKKADFGLRRKVEANAD